MRNVFLKIVKIVIIKLMKVCFFGNFDIESGICLLLKKKLELQGFEVVLCQYRYDILKNIFSIIRAYVNLAKKHRNLNYDIMIIPSWEAGITLPLAKIISKKPIIYYAMSGPYDTYVFDRKTVKQDSIKAKLLFLFEKLTSKLCDLHIVETDVEIDHYTKQIGVKKEKFRKLYIGADESKFLPCNFKNSKKIFQVLYFGSFIPLHGVEIIIKAAKTLSNHKDIVFNICGDGQTKNEMESLMKTYNLENVKFFGRVNDETLLEKINSSDVCLGIFGTSGKASYVITNKVYQILCSQKPLITLKSEAINEIHVENGYHCILVPPNDPEKLAESILFLKNNVQKRQEMAKAGRELYLKELSLEKTSLKLLQYLKDVTIDSKL